MILQADLTLTPEGWRRDLRVAVDGAGRIASVEAATAESAPVETATAQAEPGKAEPREAEPEKAELLRLPGRALLPGMVNAHSHAFQRGLRGRGEIFPDGAGSFWSWREAMYGLVESLDADHLHALSRRAFEEMRAAGITSVGEFHYLHHDASEEGYAFDEVVLSAAAEAGIRIVLLAAHYRTGGIGESLTGGQRRFDTRSLEDYWRQMERLRDALDPALQTLGVAAHSIRAVPLEEIAALHEEATGRGLVFHMHLEEQPAEIEASRARYGATPMALVNRELAVHDRTTLVHCTHTAPEEFDRYLAAGGLVCLCPLTEANLGDGLADVPRLLAAGDRVCLGTDSNARISMLEEMRLLEYGQRLSTGTRGICLDEEGAVAPRLWRCATEVGARALGLDAGRIEAGRLADFAVVDLDHPALAGWDEETLLASLILGVPDGAVTGTCVGGRWRWDG